VNAALSEQQWTRLIAERHTERRVGDATGLPDVGDLILNGEERAFLCACWIATAWRREPRPRMALRSEGV
jgi:hypothetical protein